MNGWWLAWILAIGIPGGGLAVRLLFIIHRDTHPGPIPGDPDVRTLPATGAWFRRIGTQGADRIGELRFRIFDRSRQDTAQKGPRP